VPNVFVKKFGWANFGLETGKNLIKYVSLKYFLEMCFEKSYAGILKSLDGQKMPAGTRLGSAGLGKAN
jgi:hypothetical protein